MSDRQRIRAGDKKIIVVTVLDASGDAQNLTETPAIRFALARQLGAETLVEKTLGAGVEVTDGPGGVIEVTLSPADTASLRPGGYYFEVELRDENGNPTTLEFDDERLIVEAQQIMVA